MVHTFPMVARTEASVKDAATGGHGDAQDGPVDEGPGVARSQPLLGRSRPLLVLWGHTDALRSCRAGPSSQTDVLVDGRAAGRAEEVQ